MPLRFIIGRAGSGKSAWITDQIVRALRAEPLGPPIFLIVPKQATFQAERHIAAAAGGYIRLQVVSFEDLGRIILDQVGGSAIPQIKELGRQMILGHLLRRHRQELQFFDTVAHQPGLAAEIDGAFAELERSGQNLPDLPSRLSGPGQNLLAKFHDLNIIYTAYNAFLGQDRLDQHRRLTQALANIRRCPLLPPATIYVDSCYEFTEFERQILCALAQVCRSVAIALPLDPHSAVLTDPRAIPTDMSLFHRVEQTYLRLRSALARTNSPVAEPILLHDIRRFENPLLAQVERWTDSVSELSTGLEFIESANRRAEVDAAAAQIRLWTRQGFRYRDMAVLMRNAEDYHEFIDAGFAEHGIPYFVDRRRSAAHHPLPQFIRSALLIARNNFPHDSAMALIKSGLAGLDFAQADALENYVLLHGIRRSAWLSSEPWTGRRRLADESDESPNAPRAEPEPLDQLRRQLVDRLRPLLDLVEARPASTVRQYVSAILKLIESCQVRQTLDSWMRHAEQKNRFQERDEHQAVWTDLDDLMRQMVELLGDEPVTADDFQAILDAGLSGFDLGLAPPTVDQVLVGQVDRTRTPALKAVIVLGLSEGQFPAAAPEGAIFSDLDRRILRKSQVDLDPDSERRVLDEAFLGYLAFTRASQRLCLIRGIADDDGRALKPSSLWITLRQRFGKCPLTSAPPAISTPRQLVSSLLGWARSADEQLASDDPNPALYQWLAERSDSSDPLVALRGRAWPALSYANSAALAEPIAHLLFPAPLKATVSQIESFAACAFQHFARYGLQLTVRQERRVTHGDLSIVYHEVLRQLPAVLGGAWADQSDQQARDLIHRLVLQAGAGLRRSLMLSTAKNQYLLDHIEETLDRVVFAQRAAAQRGHFRAVRANVAFADSPGSDLPPLRVLTPTGQELQISGKIDRVDIAGDAVAVLDYRLTKQTLPLSLVYHGLSMRLLIHLLVLESSGQALVGKKLTPAAAFYVQLLRKVAAGIPEQALSPGDEGFHLQIKPRGIFSAEFVTDLDASMSAGWSQVIQAFVSKDGSLGNVGKSDAADAADFSALLRHVRRKLGELGERILAGRVEVAPYRLGVSTPCPHCQMRDVCRFEQGVNRYRTLESPPRQRILESLRAGEAP